MQKANSLYKQSLFGHTDLHDFLKEVTESLNQRKPQTCKDITLRLTGGWGDDWAIIDSKTKMIAWTGDSMKASLACARYQAVHQCAKKKAEKILIEARKADFTSEYIEIDSAIEQGEWGVDEVGTCDKIDLDCPTPCTKMNAEYNFFHEVVYFRCNHGNAKGKVSFTQLLQSALEQVELSIANLIKSAIAPINEEIATLRQELDGLQQQLLDQNGKLSAERQAELPVKRSRRNKRKPGKSVAVQQAARPVKQTRHQIQVVKQKLTEQQSKIADLYKSFESDLTMCRLQTEQEQYEQMVEGPNFSACVQFLANRARAIAKAKQKKTRTTTSSHQS